MIEAALERPTPQDPGPEVGQSYPKCTARLVATLGQLVVFVWEHSLDRGLFSQQEGNEYPGREHT